MTFPPDLWVQHPRRPWSLDATAMGVSAAEIDALPWANAFAEMRDLEAGAIANPDEKRQVGHFWLRAPVRAPTVGQAREIGETAEAVRTFAAKVRSGAIRTPEGEPFTDFVQVGIGGSALGPMLLADALDGDGLAAHFLDNTDPDGIARAFGRLGDRLHTTLILVVSKSGGTVETRNGMLLARQALVDRGLSPGGRLVAVTGVGSGLDKQAQAEGWLARFAMWDWVGGRFSITSAVGLLPAELLGIDTQSLLAGARDMDEWTRAEDQRENPAALLAGSWYVAGKGRGDRAMVVLPYSDRLLLTSRYLQQLVMESLGKKLDRKGKVVEQGIVVYGNKGSTDQHAYVQQLRDGRNDFFATFVQILEDGAGSAFEVAPAITAGDYLQGFLLGTRRALAEAGRPSVTITMPRADAYELGGLIALFERAVGLYATLVDVNAYHQPGVEAGKKAAETIVALSRSLREALKAGPSDLPALAKATGADPIEAFYVLEHLVATRRAIRDEDRWRLPRGAEV